MALVFFGKFGNAGRASRMKGAVASGNCYDNETAFTLTGQYTGFLLPGMEEACPYEHVLVCAPQSSANLTCSLSPF